METRFNSLTRALLAAVCFAWLLLAPNPSAAVTTTFSNISLGAGVTDTQSILDPLVFAPSDAFEVSGVLTFTSSSTTSYDLLFVVTDGSGTSPLFGGQIEYLGPNTRVSATAGNTAGTADGAGNAFFNAPATLPLTVDFVVDGVGGTSTQATIEDFESVGNSPVSFDGGLSPLNPSAGLQIQLINRGDVSLTIDSLEIEVIPEPGVGMLLLLSSGLVMSRRRGV
ncbi:MAG: hypothetical protein AAF710_01635 [Planctomycetota bacterium]